MINWSNPLTRDLVSFNTVRNDRVYDWVNEGYGASINGPTTVMSENGYQGLKFDGAGDPNGQYVQCYPIRNWERIDGDSDFTLLIAAKPKTHVDGKRMWSLGNSGTSTFAHIAVTSGEWRSNFATQSVDTGFAATDDVEKVYGAKLNGLTNDDLFMFENEDQSGTDNTGSVGPIIWNQQSWGNLWRSDLLDRYFDGVIYWSGIWQRLLLSSEMKSMRVHPAQIFYDRQYLPFLEDDANAIFPTEVKY